MRAVPGVVRSRPELLRALARLSLPGPSAALWQVLGVLVPPPASLHTEVFVLETHPYASVHLGAEGMIGGEAADRVAGFWRTLGLSPPAGADELGALLELYARLAEEEAGAGERRAAAVGRARVVLLFEHLCPWVPVYAGSVLRAGDGAYGAWASLLTEALAGEIEAGDLPSGDELPLGLRQAPPPLEAGSRASLLGGALAPARSGMVVTPADLERAGRDLGLGVRRGERRYVLEALVGQEPRATFGWLAGLAAEWAALHRRLFEGFPPALGGWWAGRARAAADVLAASARAVPA